MTLDSLSFGNYGAYVWTSYALTFIALIVMAVAARSAAKAELKSAMRRNQINQTSQSNGGNQS
jgi:heme exporter protein CcmD